MNKSLLFVLTLAMLAAPTLFGSGQKPAEASKEPIKLTGMVRDYSMKWEAAVDLGGKGLSAEAPQRHRRARGPAV